MTDSIQPLRKGSRVICKMPNSQLFRLAIVVGESRKYPFWIVIYDGNKSRSEHPKSMTFATKDEEL